MAEDGDGTPAAGGITRLDVLEAGILADAERLGVPVTLAAMCDSAAAALGVAAVAVSVPSPGTGADTLAASGQLARAGEELQVTVGQGPSLETLSGSAPLLVDDLAASVFQTRWPLFASAAVEAGVGSLCVVPMRVGAARFGIFVAYLDRPGGLSPEALRDAVLFASLALELLLDHLEAGVLDGDSGLDGGRPDHDGAGLDGDGAGLDGDGAGLDHGERKRFGAGRAFDDRPEIHQATGMISVQLGVDLPTALLRLRARAFTDGCMLSDLAAEVVARKVRFTADPDSGLR